MDVDEPLRTYGEEMNNIIREFNASVTVTEDGELLIQSGMVTI